MVTEFRTVRGFEELWRPPVTPRARAPALLGTGPGNVRGRLSRIAGRAPEVMVKVTGRTRDAGHLRAHLDYITRKGALEAEASEGLTLIGRDQVRAIGDGWAWEAELNRRRSNAPVSLSLVLSMPAGADPLGVRDAARAFAVAEFEERHDYVLVLHTDTGRPHVHLSVQARGRDGSRLNPKKADLAAWRELFARELRDRGIGAEATPRRARGVVRKAERTPLRKLRERAESGGGRAPRRLVSAYAEALTSSFDGSIPRRDWERRIAERQARIRGLYLAQARLLQASSVPEDRSIGEAIETFVRHMPPVESRRMTLARQLGRRGREGPLRSGPDGRSRPEGEGPERGR